MPVLSLESDQARQVQVYEQVKAAYSTVSAHLIKRVITETEISVHILALSSLVEKPTKQQVVWFVKIY